MVNTFSSRMTVVILQVRQESGFPGRVDSVIFEFFRLRR
jgi:hypothetical protein